MNILDKIRNFIIDLDETEFKKYSFIIISIIIVAVSLIIYRYYSKTAYLKKQIQAINIIREEAQIILNKDLQVKEQKKIVDEILEQEKNFRIIKYFNSITDNLGISQNIKSKKIIPTELENLQAKGYVEIKLDVSMSNLDTRQLTLLLNEFEKNPRIYTKNLEVIKSSRMPTIDVDIIIATLQPREEEIEFTE